MRKSDAYPSKYFRATDFADDWTLTVEVETARMEKFQNGRDKDTEKLVVYFRRQKSGLVVGPTLWDQFIEVTGEEDCSDWKGHCVELHRDWTEFQGKDTKCIRVRAPSAPPRKPAKRATLKGEAADGFNDPVE